VRNLDRATADGFDQIWQLHGDTPGAAEPDWAAFETYLSMLPIAELAKAEGFDLGSGNGRIARTVAPRVGVLNCIEPSAAGLAASKKAMREVTNVRFHQASVDTIPLADNSQDFGYSIGVLHHIPLPEAGLRACVAKLKPGAPFVLYVYYKLDDRPAWFRLLWRASDIARRGVSKLPFRLRVMASDVAAATLYWPLCRSARLIEKAGGPIKHHPLAIYRNESWATLRADALDRLGTAVEHRFSKQEVEGMMYRAGLRDIRFADGPPYWIAMGYKA
jgi:SAM-dependent methyltransferase